MQNSNARQRRAEALKKRDHKREIHKRERRERKLERRAARRAEARTLVDSGATAVGMAPDLAPAAHADYTDTTPVTELGLGARIEKVLVRAHIVTKGQLLEAYYEQTGGQFNHLMDIPNFGPGAFDKVEAWVNS